MDLSSLSRSAIVSPLAVTPASNWRVAAQMGPAIGAAAATPAADGAARDAALRAMGIGQRVDASA